MKDKSIKAIEEITGYTFKDKSLLEEAFTHISIQNSENKNYERLEFLGDALINLVIADYLFSVYPDYAEGQLTRVKAAIVSGKSLAKLGKNLGFGEYIKIERGLRKQGVPDSLYSDVVEALCAAVFIDAGIRFVRDFIIELFEDLITEASSFTKDSKSRLQEFVQKMADERPVYDIVDISGADHEQVFSATVTVCGIIFGPCEGKTKKQSEQNAALLALQALSK